MHYTHMLLPFIDMACVAYACARLKTLKVTNLLYQKFIKNYYFLFTSKSFIPKE